MHSYKRISMLLGQTGHCHIATLLLLLLLVVQAVNTRVCVYGMSTQEHT
jgi:hypothetical protein